jgi:hypothetical protein
MILGRQVHSLLKRHSSVFVLGLGTFRRIRTAASYDAKRNVVLPPLSYIEFEHDSQEGYDFALYVQQINQVEKLEAERIVQQEVDKLIDAIHTDGQATLDELGSLVSYGHSFIFKPLDLSGFQFVPIEDPYQKVMESIQEEVHEEIPNIAPSVPVTEPSSHVEETVVSELIDAQTAIEEQTPIENASVNSFQQHREEPLEYFEETQKRSNAVVYALIAIVALIAMGGIYYYSILSKKLDNVDQFLSAMDSTDFVEDTTSYNVDSNAIATVDSSALVPSDSLASTVQQVPTATVEEPVLHKYTIVVGTHPKYEQAEAEAAEYQKKGFKHVRALPSNLEKNRKKVIWDTYPTKEMRDSALRYVQKNVKADAWPAVL